MIKKAIHIYIAVFSLASLFGFVPALSQAVLADPCAKEVKILTIDPWYHNLCKPGTNEVTFDDNPSKTVGQIGINILSIALQIGGYIAVGFVIWGGLKYVLAAGDSGKLASAKNVIQNALIGLLIALSAVAILNFIQLNI